MPDFILHRIKPWLDASSEMAWMSPQSAGNLSSWRSWNKCHHCSHLFLWIPLLPHPSFLLTEDTMALYWLVKKVALLGDHTCPSVGGRLGAADDVCFTVPWDAVTRVLSSCPRKRNWKRKKPHYALQLRCNSEDEVFWFYWKANLPEPTFGTVHMSCLPWGKHMPVLLENADTQCSQR